MSVFLIGKKLGVTMMYSGDVASCVTLVKVGENKVLNVLSDKYKAIKVGAFNTKESKLNVPQVKDYKTKHDGFFPSVVHEFRVEDSELELFQNGQEINVDDNLLNQYVDTTSFAKGKGFQGCMKRHNFGGMNASHGVSVTHRHGGSTGNRTLPGRVFKGKKMAGRMGGKKVTQQNLQIVFVDNESSIIGIKGSVPGHENSIVYIKSAIKKKTYI